MSPPTQERRSTPQVPLLLKELPPDKVVQGVFTEAGFVAEAVTPYGAMRETCPHCERPLQLVLRHGPVLRTHLFCTQCTRCFDACFATGRSALALDSAPIG